MSDEKTPPTPDFTAQLDQMQTHLENLANLMATYYKHLVEQGVDQDLVFALVIELQDKILTQKPS